MANIIFEFIIQVFHLSILHLIAYFETTRRQQYDVKNYFIVSKNFEVREGVGLLPPRPPPPRVSDGPLDQPGGKCPSALLSS